MTTERKTARSAEAIGNPGKRRSIEEISRHTGLSANHIRVKIHRIRKLLLKLMGIVLIAMVIIAKKK